VEGSSFRELWLGFTWWHFAVSRFVVGKVQEVAKAVLEEQEVSLVPVVKSLDRGT